MNTEWRSAKTVVARSPREDSPSTFAVAARERSPRKWATELFLATSEV